jgi:pSer/pThr/pTyr-binding forkhead associated (FHA) protein
MAKQHKHANNSIALDTVLSIADLKAICAQAAVESTGDLWNGTNKIVAIDSGDTWIQYVIQGGIVNHLRLMTFMLSIEHQGGRSTLSTEIVSYSTSQQTVMFIPVSPKKMVVRHTYLQFVNKIASAVRLADASARIVLSEGEWMPQAALSTVATVAAPVAVDSASIMPAQVAAPTPPPPPPPAPPAAVAAPAPPGAPPPPPPPVAEIDERTQKSARVPRSRQWLVTPQGQAPVQLLTTLVVGRQPSAGVNDGGIVTVPRGEDTVSKSHARFELIDDVVHVTDLESINGTFLVGPDEVLIECEPNTPISIPPGYMVELGDFTVTVEAPPEVRTT